MTELITRALDVNAANLALGNERLTADGATLVRNRDMPRIYNANHVSNVTASTPDEIERLLARVEREYEHCRHRQFDVDFRAPPAFVARLALEGYQREDALVMLLEGELNGARKEHDIRPVQTEADWQAYAELHEIDWREEREKQKLPVEPGVEQDMMRARQAKQPPVQNWMAYVDGRPVAYFNLWAGIDGIGQVEDLFTHPGFRHRGLAAALIHHCVADCRGKGAGAVVIACDPSDTPKNMYSAMGFGPVALVTHYLRKPAS